ncbi:MAG: hypothetical protein IPM36_20920 [Lewinellaceae bacterium]|nr:hypothetical protein [Lewinellaceae bacterium]
MIRCARMGEDVGRLVEQFIFALNHFHSAYLQHMLEEEEKPKTTLELFSYADLDGNAQPYFQENAPESRFLLWFRYAIPAMQPWRGFNGCWARGMAAPAPFMEQAMAVLETVLPEKAYRQLTFGLN